MAGRKIEVQIVGDSRSIEAALGRAQSKTSKFGQTLTSAGSMLTRSLTLPIVGAGVAAGKMAFDFDEAMTHVQALTGASAKQTKQWSDQILSLAPKIGVGPQELADSLYFVASSGAKVNQVLPITTASAKAAAAGMGDAQTVAQLLTSAINAYGAANLSATQASDVLTESIKVGKAEPAELAQNLGRVIPLAQAMGVSFGEAAALVSTLTNTGLDAAESVTGVRAALTGLIKPAAQSKAELKDLGLSVGGVQQEIRDKGLLTTLQDLRDRLGDNKSAMAKLFPNVRALTAFLALTGENSKQAARNVDLVTHSTGAASKAFATAAKGPAFQFHQSLAQLQATAIKLGNQLLPVFNRILKAVSSVADAFSGLSESQQNLVLIGAAAAAALGPVLTLAGNLVKLGTALGIISRTAPAAAAGMGEVEAASAGGALSLARLVPLLAAAAAGYELWTHRTRSHISVSDNFTKAQADLNQRISTGQMNAQGWNQVIQRSTGLASGAQKALGKLADSGIQKVSDMAKGEARQNLNRFIAQMTSIGNQASIAGRNLDGRFTPAQVRAYKTAARFARTAAQLASAINAVPSTKYVQLVVSIISNFRTEGIAPGQGADESSHLGPGQTGTGHKYRSGGTRSGGNVVIPVHIDGREVARAVVSQDRLHRRTSGRSLFA